jgi:hypothetical protein
MTEGDSRQSNNRPTIAQRVHFPNLERSDGLGRQKPLGRTAPESNEG